VTEKSIRQQFADTMLEVGRVDPDLVVLVGDISHFILQPFAQACPGRYYNVGICEPTILSMAAGLSKIGFHPVVHTIAPFIVERGFEQMKLDFSYQKLGGNLVTLGSVFDYSNLGCTHHCYGDFALLKTLPGSEIVYPGSPAEFDALFRQRYRNSALTLFRIPGHSHGQSFRQEDIQFGRAIRLAEGRDATLVATGPQLRNVLAAKDSLAGMGWEAEILYLHTIRPLDQELIRDSLAKTRQVLVIEEHMQTGGVGDDVLRATREMSGVRYASLAIPDVFLHEYGSYQDHCETLGFTPEGIVSRVKGEFEKHKRRKSRMANAGKNSRKILFSSKEQL